MLSACDLVQQYIFFVVLNLERSAVFSLKLGKGVTLMAFASSNS